MFAYFRKTIQSINSFIYVLRSALLSCLLIFSITLPLVYYLAISMATAVAVTVMMISMLAFLAFAHRAKNSPSALLTVKMMLANLKQTIQSMLSVIQYYWINLVRIIIPGPIYDADSATLTFSSKTSVITKEMLTPYRDIAKKIIIPHGVTKIGDWTFAYYNGLTCITIPNSVTKIGHSAFSGCTSLDNINIPDSVRSIESDAFRGCSVLTNIDIPNGVTSIGDRAFRNCSNLTSIELPNSVTEIKEDVFSGCTSLANITIPNGVRSIESHAFYGCTSLTNIDIPNGVTSIGDRAFRDCSNLTSIELPNSVTEIGYRAFASCRSLANITIPNSVKSIGEYAFNGCRGLTEITIPNSVTEIGYNAFRGCTELKYIIVPKRYKNQTSDFWDRRGVDINRTAIYGMQDLIQNTDLQTEVLKSYREGANFPVYKSLTLLNPLSHLPISNLITASSTLANLCLPRVVLPGGAGLVNASKYNWQQLLRPLSSKVVGCADALAPWLSLYDIARIQMAKATELRSEDIQVFYDRLRALQSEEFEKSSHLFTLRNPHRTLPQSNLNEFSREDQARPAA